MKLKTKLIPLASIVTACAAVTPLALTSCGSKKWVDLMEMYTPDFDKMELSSSAQPLSDEQAMKAWTEKIEDEPERFAQENYWSESRNLQIINSRAFVNNYDPNLMWSDIINGNAGGTVVWKEFNKNYSFNQANERYIFSDISNKLEYSKYKERMTNISITTQKFIYYDYEESNQRHELDIPTISFTLEFDRTYNTAYNGMVAKSNSNKAQVFYMQAERKTTGSLVFENVPVWIADLQDRAGVNCWTIVPFIQWGCESSVDEYRHSYDQYLIKKYGITINDDVETGGHEDATLYPKAWSITCKYHNSQVGNYLSDTNGFNVDFDADTTEQLTLEEMPKDVEYLSNMSIFNYIVDGGILQSWYIHNAPAMSKSMHLWALDYFWGSY